MNEQPLLTCYCKYKWHYKTHAEHERACEDDEFGYHTLVSIYQSRVLLSNNYYGGMVPKSKREKGVEYNKQVTHKEFTDMLNDGSIEGKCYDWELELLTNISYFVSVKGE